MVNLSQSWRLAGSQDVRGEWIIPLLLQRGLVPVSSEEFRDSNLTNNERMKYESEVCVQLVGERTMVAVVTSVTNKNDRL